MRLSKDGMYCTCYISLILFIICAVIGLPTVIYGCDTYYTDCVKYTYAQKTVMQVSAYRQTGSHCNVWISIKGISTCASFEEYIYYSAVVHFDTCSYSLSGEFKTQDKATNYALYYYPIGSTIKMAVSKDNPKKCEYPSGLPKNLAIVGIVFSSLAGIFAIILLVDIILLCLTKEQVHVVQTPNNIRQAIAV